MIAAAEASLKRLGTNYIDLYQVHFDDQITPLEELVSAMDNLVQRGLVRYVGFSNFNAWRAAIAMEIQKQQNLSKFVSAQMYYSLVGRDLENEFVPFAKHNNVGILVWSPLAGSFLSGKYSRENPQGDGGRLNTFDFIPRDEELSYQVIDLVKNLSQKYEATPAQISMAWLLSKDYITSVIVGATKMSHFEDNVKSMNIKLMEEDILQLEKLTAPALLYPNWLSANTKDPMLENLEM